MAEEFSGSGVSESTASEGTSGAEEQTSDSGSVLDAVVDNSETKSATEGETESGDGVEPTGDGGKPAPKAEPKASKVGVDPELLAFAQAKGLTEADLKSEGTYKTVRAYREAEKRMNQQQAEIDRYKREELARAEEDAKRQSEPEKSPVEDLNAAFQGQIAYECRIHRCTNATELKTRFPDVWGELEGSYREQLVDAQRKEVRWELDKRDRERNKSAANEKLEQERAQVKEIASANLRGYREKDKDFDRYMVRSGATAWIDRIAKAAGADPAYFHADKQTMDFLARASKAMVLVESGQLQQKAKQDVEKAIEKAKKAELPATDSPLPDDHEALRAAWARRGKGVSLVAK